MRWRGGKMILRWVVTAVAAGRFRRRDNGPRVGEIAPDSRPAGHPVIPRAERNYPLIGRGP